MGISREDAAILARRGPGKAQGPRSPVVEGWSGGALTVFVPGRPHNPLNGGQRSYMKHARLRKQWREGTAMRLLVWSARHMWSPDEFKRVTFTVYGPSAFDDDNLEAVCKSARDSLKDCALIQDDRPSAGHTFVYTQAKPSRKAGAVYGIAVRIEAVT